MPRLILFTSNASTVTVKDDARDLSLTPSD